MEPTFEYPLVVDSEVYPEGNKDRQHEECRTEYGEQPHRDDGKFSELKGDDGSRLTEDN